MPRAGQVLLGARSGCFIALGQRQFPEFGANLEPFGARAGSEQEISRRSRRRVSCREAFTATRSSSLSPTDAKVGHRLRSFAVRCVSDRFLGTSLSAPGLFELPL